MRAVVQRVSRVSVTVDAGGERGVSAPSTPPASCCSWESPTTTVRSRPCGWRERSPDCGSCGGSGRSPISARGCSWSASSPSTATPGRAAGRPGRRPRPDRWPSRCTRRCARSWRGSAFRCRGEFSAPTWRCSLVNDGPVTIWLETPGWREPDRPARCLRLVNCAAPSGTIPRAKDRCGASRLPAHSPSSLDRDRRLHRCRAGGGDVWSRCGRRRSMPPTPGSSSPPARRRPSDGRLRQQPVPERSGRDPEGHLVRAAGDRRGADPAGDREHAPRPDAGAALAQDQGAGRARHRAAQDPGGRRRPEDGAGDQQAGRPDPPEADRADRDRPRQDHRQPQGHDRRSRQRCRPTRSRPTRSATCSSAAFSACCSDSRSR